MRKFLSSLFILAIVAAPGSALAWTQEECPTPETHPDCVKYFPSPSPVPSVKPSVAPSVAPSATPAAVVPVNFADTGSDHTLLWVLAAAILVLVGGVYLTRDRK